MSDVDGVIESSSGKTSENQDGILAAFPPACKRETRYQTTSVT